MQVTQLPEGLKENTLVISRMEDVKMLTDHITHLSVSCQCPIHTSASKIDASKIATILNCRCPTVGLDMEWRTPRPVSLIQISSDSKIFLVDTIPCTTSVDTAQVPDPEYANAICDALIHLFTEQRVRKIGFSFGSDMRQIHPVFPQIKNSTLHNFVDLQALVPNLSSFSQAASKPQKIRPKKAPYDKKGKTAAPAKKVQRHGRHHRRGVW